MNLEEYKKIAVQRLNKSISSNPKESMYYACMGLIEETGEVIAELRKAFFKGNFHERTFHSNEMESELGDLIWYMALICENYNIDMNRLKVCETDDGYSELSKREKIINISINMGQVSGEIVSDCMKVYSGSELKQELIEKMKEQYKSINQLARHLNISIDEVLKINLRKINSRYNEKGEVIR